MARISVNVALAQGAELARVESALRSLGLSVESSDAELGFVSGSCEESALERLQGVPGVAAVERGHSYQLPEPGQPQ